MTRENYLKNREHHINYSRDYYRKNREKISLKTKLWRKSEKGRKYLSSKSFKNRVRKYIEKIKKFPNYYEKRRIYAKNWRAKVRTRCIEFYGSKCFCCGEKNERFLTLDHLKNDGYVHKKLTWRGIDYYKWAYQHDFPKGVFQLSCYNCNMGRALEKDKVCPHKKC